MGDNGRAMERTRCWTPKLRPGHVMGWMAVLILGSGFAMMVFPLFAILAMGGLGQTKDDVTADWPQFYQSEVKGYFWIPPEATIRHAERRDEFLGGGFLVVFSLPEGKEQKHMLELMAQKSKIYPYRKSKYKFDAGGDIYRLEYFPSRGVFEAEYMWD
jgi:hypothetical protein